MDRRYLSLVLLLAALCASGCAAPRAQQTAEKQTERDEQSPTGSGPEQTAAAVDETLRQAQAAHSTTAAAVSADDKQSAADTPESLDATNDEPLDATTSRARVAGRQSKPSDRQHGSAEPAVDRQTLMDVIDQIQAAGVLDAKARGQLLDDLKQTDPSLWPQLLTYFQASLARDQAVARQQSPVKRAAFVEPAGGYDVEEVIVSDEPAVELPSRKTASDSTNSRQTNPASATKKQIAPTVDPVRLQTQSNTPQPAADASTSVMATPDSSPAPAAPAGESTVKRERDWREHLAAAIAGLEQQTNSPADSNAAIGRHAALRLLYLADGRRDAAVKPIVGIPAAQQDFWSKEMFGLATYLDADRNSEVGRRAAEAAVHLQGAAGRLAEQATLVVKNVSFCTEVSSFGVYKKFAQSEFQAGQEVLLYAEVENFRSEQTEKGYHTAFKASYQILDTHGARVAEHEFKLTEEYCQNPRRDYFTNYFVWLPKRIYGGTYTLQLTLEDVKGQKIGQSSIEFTIKEKP